MDRLAGSVHPRLERCDLGRQIGSDLAERPPDVVPGWNTVHPRERLVDPDVATIRVRDAEADRRVAEERVGLRSLRGELSLELLLPRYIGEIAADERRAVLVGRDHCDVAHPQLATCGRCDTVLDGHRLTRVAHSLERGEVAGEIGRDNPALPEVRAD